MSICMSIRLYSINSEALIQDQMVFHEQTPLLCVIPAQQNFFKDLEAQRSAVLTAWLVYSVLHRQTGFIPTAFLINFFMKKFLRENGLSLLFLSMTILTLGGQILVGWHEFNDDLSDYGRASINLRAYLTSGHCIEAVFENWESEFLQMGMYVLLTVSLYQKGSSESKRLDKPEEVDREPSPTRKGVPWPVRRGGWVLKLYQNSLSTAFFLLFSLSFWLHAVGGVKQYNTEQALKGKSEVLTLWQFLGTSEFWFQSLQNWQSEFLSVLSIVVLSIFLRQKGSPESKPVDASNDETGK